MMDQNDPNALKNDEKSSSAQIVITQHATYKSAMCEMCRWISVDQKRLERNVENHKKRHSPQPSVVRRKFRYHD